MPSVDSRLRRGDRGVLVGLLGHGIGASRTPRMHMAEGTAQGLDYDYRLIDLADCDPAPGMEEILIQVEAAGFDGLNVTFPFKQAIIPHLSELSENARNVGAVNTVVFEDGRRLGHNTDYWGFAESFRRGLPDANRDAVLLIGAGGAGGAVSAALLGSGVKRLMIHDTNPGAAARLAKTLGVHFGEDRAEVVTDLDTAASQVDGIVNASPVGMVKLPGLPLPKALIATRHWVADIVYFPLETALLASARALGCAVLPGSGMALFQAVRAFELFTGLPADPTRMQATFDEFNSGAAA
ncbi:shikimate dehydrogenase [Loktanella sp. M215]|nr:shikimate dehydrogenase [Loktanella sp. M215]